MMSPPGWSATCGVRPHAYTSWITYKLDSMGKEKKNKKSQSWVGRDRKVVTGEGLGERRIGSKYAVSNSQGIDKSVDKDEEGWLLRNSTHGWHLSTHMHVYLREHVSLHSGRRLFKFPLVSQPSPPVALCSSCSFTACAIGNVLDSLLQSFD